MAENRYEEKSKLMKELINLYEQVEHVSPEASRLVVEDYIVKKERALESILYEEIIHDPFLWTLTKAFNIAKKKGD